MKKFIERQKEKREEILAQKAARSPRQVWTERTLVCLGIASVIIGYLAGMIFEGLLGGLLLIGVFRHLYARRGAWFRNMTLEVLLVTGVIPFIMLAVIGYFLQSESYQDFLKQKASIEDDMVGFEVDVDRFVQDVEAGFVGAEIIDTDADGLMWAARNSVLTKPNLAWILSGSNFLLAEAGPNDILPISAVAKGHRSLVLFNPMTSYRNKVAADARILEISGLGDEEYIATKGATAYMELLDDISSGLVFVSCVMDEHDNVLFLNSIDVFMVDLLRYPEAQPLVEICRKYGSYGGDISGLPTLIESLDHARK